MTTRRLTREPAANVARMAVLEKSNQLNRRFKQVLQSCASGESFSFLYKIGSKHIRSFASKLFYALLKQKFFNKLLTHKSGILRKRVCSLNKTVLSVTLSLTVAVVE